MTTTTTAPILLEQVLKVYSGKAHACCCGCSGIYRILPERAEEAGADRGYPYDAAEDVNPAFVRKVLKKVNAALADPAVCDELDAAGEYVAATYGNRLYVVYLRRAA